MNEKERIERRNAGRSDNSCIDLQQSREKEVAADSAGTKANSNPTSATTRTSSSLLCFAGAKVDGAVHGYVEKETNLDSLLYGQT